MSYPRRRLVAFASIAMVLGITAALVLLEGLLRLLPVRESLIAQPVNETSPYLHFRPNRDSIYSAAWNFEILNKVHVNNYGFVNDQDYDPRLKTPLLAVVGDSYVEAAMIPYEETLHARLARDLGSRARVYSFGASGSALSQYLAYARYARDTFRPTGLVVVVVGNDFDESLLEYKSDPGFHYLRRSALGELALYLIPFEPPLFRRALMQSALARYLAYNTGLGGLRHRFAGNRAYVGNVSESAEPMRVLRSKQAIDYFLERLPEHSGLAPGSILIVVDGMRRALYDDKALEVAQGSYFDIMRRTLFESASAKGYRVIDMQPRFIERYKKDGRRFEWPFDGHWNSIGHDEAASAVIESGFLQEWTAPSRR